MKQAILCVDDEPLILLALRHELSHHFGARYTYEIADDADDALEVIEELAAEGVEIALIISDWLMPGMKGDEFLDIVSAKHPSIRAIIISGQADEAAIRRIKEKFGLIGFFGKPYDPKLLFRAIETEFPSEGPSEGRASG